MILILLTIIAGIAICSSVYFFYPIKTATNDTKAIAKTNNYETSKISSSVETLLQQLVLPNSVGFRIAHFSTERSYYKSIMKSLYYKTGGIIDIYNFNQLADRDPIVGKINLIQYDGIRGFPKTIPSLSVDNSIYLDGGPILAGSYYHSYSGNSDAVFSYKYSRGVPSNDLANWVNDSKFVEQRTKDTSILQEKNGHRTKGSHIILHKYIYNGKNAVHMNYTTVYDSFEKKENIQSFYSAMNYLNNFIKDNKLEYFSAAGDSNILSGYWQKIITNVFGDSVYISPGEKEKVFTCNDNSGLSCPDFIFVCKNMAPHGVSFYIDDPLFDISTQHYYVVCELFKTDNNQQNNLIRNKHKLQCETIYENTQYRVKHAPKTKVFISDPKTVDLKNIDPNKILTYEPNKNSFDCRHINYFIKQLQP